MLKSVPELVAAARKQLRCVDAATAVQEIRENQGTVLDVREPAEAQAQPTSRSQNIPRGVLEMKITELNSDPEHPLYIHCATGGRATFAAEQLERMGYSRVTVITCPIDTVREQLASLA